MFAGFFKKTIPVVGGVLGGGITFLIFKPCCDKLKAALQKTILSDPNYQINEDHIAFTEYTELSDDAPCSTAVME